MGDVRWYSLEDMPKGRVHCVISYGAYEHDAVFAQHPKHKVMCWAFMKARHLIWQPLYWQPERWRPRQHLAFTWPNGIEPQPLPVRVKPRFISAETPFQATLAAEERAADKRDADAGLRSEEIPEPQWWRDVTRVKYQPMGDVSEEMAEGRIMRALILDYQIKMDMRRQKSNAAVLSDLKAGHLDVLRETPDDDWVPPLTPTVEDHADYHTVMGWLVEYGLSKREELILRGRSMAPPREWATLADIIAYRESTKVMYGKAIKKMFMRAIVGITSCANRPAVHGPALARKLRERNRAHRREFA